MKKFKVKNEFDYFLRRCAWKSKCSGGCDCTKTNYGHIKGYFQSGGYVESFIVIPEGETDFYKNEISIDPNVIILEDK